MKLIKLSAIVVASAVMVACGGGGSSSSGDDDGASSSGGSAVIMEGENSFTSTELIEAVLENTTEITTNQEVTFVLPEDKQTLVLTKDLNITGNLTIK